MKLSKPILVSLISLGVICSIVLIMPSKKADSKVNAQNDNPTVADTSSKIEHSTYPLTYNVIDLHSYSKDEWPTFVNAYEVLDYKDERLFKYFPQVLFEDPYQQLIFVPNNIQYDYNIESIEVQHKTIRIKYSTGSAKIPRMVGHKQQFDSKIIAINTRSLADAVYKVEISNVDGTGETIVQEVDFVNNYKEIDIQIKGLAFGKENQLLYSTNSSGDWQLWEVDLSEREEGDTSLNYRQITTRHTDVDAEGLPELGVQNLNAKYPIYNKRLQKFIYSSEYDIYELSSDGYKNYPLTRQVFNSNQDGFTTFETEPKITDNGVWIFYKHIYSPISSELYYMHSDGEYQTRIPMPQDGNVDVFDVSSDGSEVIVSLSTGESSIMNGRSNLWTIYPLSNESPRRISTGGYHINSIDLSSNDKNIALSLTLSETKTVGNTDIWTVNSNNTDLVRLTPQDNYMEIEPVWSPDGERIAFFSGDGEQFTVWVMNKDGSNRYRLSSSLYVKDKPVWSPDGSKVFVITDTNNIYSIDIFSLEEKLIL